jgi:hypothetical protein
MAVCSEEKNFNTLTANHMQSLYEPSYHDMYYERAKILLTLWWKPEIMQREELLLK